MIDRTSPATPARLVGAGCGAKNGEWLTGSGTPRGRMVRDHGRIVRQRHGARHGHNRLLEQNACAAAVPGTNAHAAPATIAEPSFILPAMS
jgi:hypothetical protein